MKAFPSKIIDFQESQFQGRTVYQDENEGMDLRDYFAAKAMQSYMSHHLKTLSEGKQSFSVMDMADSSYVVADAMLKQRELNQ